TAPCAAPRRPRPRVGHGTAPAFPRVCRGGRQSLTCAAPFARAGTSGWWYRIERCVLPLRVAVLRDAHHAFQDLVDHVVTQFQPLVTQVVEAVVHGLLHTLLHILVARPVDD